MKRLTLIMVVALLMGSTARGQSAFEANTGAIDVTIDGSAAHGKIITYDGDIGLTITISCDVEASAKAYATSVSSSEHAQN